MTATAFKSKGRGETVTAKRNLYVRELGVLQLLLQSPTECAIIGLDAMIIDGNAHHVRATFVREPGAGEPWTVAKKTDDNGKPTQADDFRVTQNHRVSEYDARAGELSLVSWTEGGDPVSAGAAAKIRAAVLETVNAVPMAAFIASKRAVLVDNMLAGAEREIEIAQADLDRAAATAARAQAEIDQLDALESELKG